MYVFAAIESVVSLANRPVNNVTEVVDNETFFQHLTVKLLFRRSNGKSALPFNVDNSELMCRHDQLLYNAAEIIDEVCKMYVYLYVGNAWIQTGFLRWCFRQND